MRIRNSGTKELSKGGGESSTVVEETRPDTQEVED